MAIRGLDGFFANFYKCILLFFNTLILILGLLVFILAAILKWDKKLLNIKELEEIVNLGKIDSITIFFLIIGAVAIVISLIGIVGLCCLNKFLLYVYEVIVLLLFLSHAIALLVLVFGRSSIEKSINEEIKNVVDRLNTNASSFDEACQTMKGLSNLFHCCGNKNVSDFDKPYIIQDCCQDSNSTSNADGCSDKINDFLEDKSISYLIIPSCVILGVELIVIIFTPFIIRHVKRLDYH